MPAVSDLHCCPAEIAIDLGADSGYNGCQETQAVWERPTQPLTGGRRPPSRTKMQPDEAEMRIASPFGTTI